jgi:hypothetical protein
MIRKDFHRHHFQGLAYIDNLLMCFLLLNESLVPEPVSTSENELHN